MSITARWEPPPALQPSSVPSVKVRSGTWGCSWQGRGTPLSAQSTVSPASHLVKLRDQGAGFGGEVRTELRNRSGDYVGGVYRRPGRFSLSLNFYGDVYTSPSFFDAYGYDLLGNGFEIYLLPTSAGPTSLEAPSRAGASAMAAGGRPSSA